MKIDNMLAGSPHITHFIICQVACLGTLLEQMKAFLGVFTGIFLPFLQFFVFVNTLEV